MILTAETLRSPSDPELFFDNSGLIVQKDGDGGDTAQREGWVWFGKWYCAHIGMPSLNLPISLERTIELLEVDHSGDFRRHPSQEKWRDSSEFSRDQQIPLIAAMGVSDVKDVKESLQRMRKAVRQCPYPIDELQKLIKEQIKNLPPGYLLQELVDFKWLCVQGTKDLVSPAHMNLFARALNSPPTDLGDIQLLADVSVRLTQAGSDPDDVGDDLNMIINLLMAEVRFPSLYTKMAIELYRKNRPVCYGCFLGSYRNAYPNDFTAAPSTMKNRMRDGIHNRGWSPDCPRVLGALRWYFRAETNANPALAELYAPIIDRVLS